MRTVVIFAVGLEEAVVDFRLNAADNLAPHCVLAALPLTHHRLDWLHFQQSAPVLH